MSKQVDKANLWWLETSGHKGWSRTAHVDDAVS